MWWGAASPKLNDTPVIYTYIYMSYNSTHIKNAYIYIYINTELLDRDKGHQGEKCMYFFVLLRTCYGMRGVYIHSISYFKLHWHWYLTASGLRSKKAGRPDLQIDKPTAMTITECIVLPPVELSCLLLVREYSWRHNYIGFGSISRCSARSSTTTILTISTIFESMTSMM